MDKEIKKKWTDALRSGEYKQTTRRLKQTNKYGNDFYCCLGVLCDVVGVEWVPLYERQVATTYDAEYDSSIAGAALPHDVQRITGIGRSTMNKLMQLNDDHRYDFHEIANWIDKNL